MENKDRLYKLCTFEKAVNAMKIATLISVHLVQGCVGAASGLIKSQGKKIPCMWDGAGKCQIYQDHIWTVYPYGNLKLGR